MSNPQAEGRAVRHPEEGKDPATAVVDPPAVAGRTRGTLRLHAERLEIRAHQGAYVWFVYEPEPHARFVHQGRIEYLARPIPPHGVHPDEMPTLLRIEHVWHALPAGTLVTIETGELR